MERGADRVFENEGFLAGIDVADGICLLLHAGGAGGQNAVADVDLADVVIAGIGIGGDAGAEVNPVADEAFITHFDGFDQSFAGIGASVIDGDGPAIQGTASVVGEFGGVERIGAA